MRLTEENYVELAEKAMRDICDERDKKDRKVPPVTTSKIRNLLAMTADIYNEVIGSQDDKLSNEIRGKINYLKIRFVYEAGREPKVKTLVEKAEILHHIDDIKNRGHSLYYSAAIWRHWWRTENSLVDMTNRRS